MVVSKKKLNEEEMHKHWHRILFPIMKRGEHSIIDLCTTEG